jgi:hypothetical protein
MITVYKISTSTTSKAAKHTVGDGDAVVANLNLAHFNQGNQDTSVSVMHFPRTGAGEGNEYPEILCQAGRTNGRAIADRGSKQHIYGHDLLQHGRLESQLQELSICRTRVPTTSHGARIR